MSAVLSVVFTGLCALVTDGDRAPGQVLLVDTRGLAASAALPRHAPTLVASLALLANPDVSRPSRLVTAWPERGASAPGEGGSGLDLIGIWDLTGAEVRIKVQGHAGAGLELYEPAPGASSWPEAPRRPEERESWRDLRFLASMSLLTGDGRIDPALVAVAEEGRAALPRGVAARIHLDRGRLEAGPPSQEIHAADVFEFARPGRRSSHRQALTDTIRWSLDAEDAVVVVEIRPVAGGPTKRLVLAPQARPRTLYVGNLPAEDAPHESHEDASHRGTASPHFVAYYDLLRNAPAARPVPTLWLGPRERKGAGGGRPAFCGPAVFSRR
jgi:hypothetical protein